MAVVSICDHHFMKHGNTQVPGKQRTPSSRVYRSPIQGRASSRSRRETQTHHFVQRRIPAVIKLQPGVLGLVSQKL